MPQYELEEPSLAEALRIPILPHISNSPLSQAPEYDSIDSVSKPQISTVSANGTHIDSPSAMTDVTDNHAMHLDPYDLTSKVANAANKVTDLASQKLPEPGSIKQLWTGLVDDIFGERKPTPA